jgi:AcrR family transcriptional regulator
MQDMFDEVGLSAGAVYRYFASKEDMVLAIAAESLSETIAIIHSFAMSSESQSLGMALGNALEALERKHAKNQMASISMLSWAEALRNPELARRGSELIGPMREDLTELVRRLQANGELPRDPAPEALGAVLMSLISGFILQLALLDDQPQGAVVNAVRALWPADRDS